MSLSKLITFEGGEGSGKSTQAQLLERALKAAGYDAILTHEPGGTEGAQEIRNLLVTGKTDRWDAMTETLLHFAARREHVKKKVKPALEKGEFVISDRFTDSTLAYQGYGHGVDLTQIEALRKMVIGDFAPGLTFICDISVKDGLERTKWRYGNEDRYERMDKSFHERLRDGFLKIAGEDKERCVVLDATRNIEAIHNYIIKGVNDRFNLDLPALSTEEVAYG